MPDFHTKKWLHVSLASEMPFLNGFLFKFSSKIHEKRVLGLLGRLLGALGGVLERLGLILDRLGASWARLGAENEPS